MEGDKTFPVAGPSRIGQIGAIAAGTHTEILEVIAPSVATPGDLVTVEVRLKNIDVMGALWVLVTCSAYAGPEEIYIDWSPSYHGFDEYGEIVTFTSSFIMPDRDIILNIWSWYSDGVQYVQDGLYVITIKAPAPVFAGEILETLIWYEPLATWEALISGREVPLNSEVYLDCTVVNRSDTSELLRLWLSVTYPDGTKSYFYLRKEIAPDGIWRVERDPFITLQEGDYSIMAALTIEAQVVDRKFYSMKVVTPVEPTGEIFRQLIWHSPLVSWEHLISGREIPLGEEIYLLPYWRSNLPIVGHVDLTVTYPDGTMRSLAATEFQDYEGTGHGVTFEPFISSQEGTYTIVITLSHEGQVLDSVTFELVVAAVAEYEGALSRKELDYQNIWQALPLYDILVGTRTRVRISGRNDMNTDQKMGIYWFVSDPEGYVAQEYENWETFRTGPGLEQSFVGSGFDLSKVGKYTIWVEVLMNPDNREVVDEYIGDLCTVVPAEEYAGAISRKELKYDTVTSPIPGG